jgi:hypothetical protein
MNKVLLYIWVNNLENSAHFLSRVANLFKVETSDDEIGERILSFRDNNAVKLSIKENQDNHVFAQERMKPNYSFALEVNNCQTVYKNIKNQTVNHDWKISQEFFGEYLATPIGDQFAIVEKNGSKILIFDKVNSEQ